MAKRKEDLYRNQYGVEDPRMKNVYYPKETYAAYQDQSTYEVTDPHYKETPMTVGQWFGTIFLLAIPLVGLICFFKWLFGYSKYRVRTNYVRATFIWGLIFLVIVGVVAILIFAVGIEIPGLSDALDGLMGS